MAEENNAGLNEATSDRNLEPAATTNDTADNNNAQMKQTTESKKGKAIAPLNSEKVIVLLRPAGETSALLLCRFYVHLIFFMLMK